MFFKICALKIFSNFTGKCQCFHKCFPLKFAKFWRFFYRTSSVVASVNCFWDICLSFQALRFPKFPKFLMRNMFWRSDWREEGQNTQFVIRYLSVFGRIRSLRTIFGNIHIQFECRKIMNKISVFGAFLRKKCLWKKRDGEREQLSSCTQENFADFLFFHESLSGLGLSRILLGFLKHNPENTRISLGFLKPNPENNSTQAYLSICLSFRMKWVL